jgi:hypothetical protein
MMVKNKKASLTLFFTICLSVLGMAQLNTISVHKKSQVLKDGIKQTIEADCYYSATKGVFVSHYYEPKEFIKKTNRKGEMQIYFPEDNKVSIRQDFYFSSENELLHYFVNNLIEDLGLRKEGFELTNTQYEEKYLVTTWSAPPDIKAVRKVEIVFENMRPIYSAYFNNSNEIIRKIYYSQYFTGINFVLPKKITEISYNSPTDSIIRRTIFSDIKQNNQVNTYYLNYEIPDDAKIIK